MKRRKSRIQIREHPTCMTSTPQDVVPTSTTTQSIPSKPILQPPPLPKMYGTMIVTTITRNFEPPQVVMVPPTKTVVPPKKAIHARCRRIAPAKTG